jgi:hypothetical protein
MSLEPITLRLQGRGGWLQPGSFLIALRAFWSVLRALDASISSEPRGSVDWEISGFKRSGPAEIVFIGHLKRPPKDILPELKKALMEGVSALAKSQGRPAIFSNHALANMRILAQERIVLDEVAIAVNGREEAVQPSMAAHIDLLTNSNYEALGSIVGRIESISVEKEPRMRVRCESTGRMLTCKLSGEEILRKAKQQLGKRSAVSGKLRYNHDDEPVRMLARGIEEWPEPDTLPNIAYMSGRISKLTRGATVGTYIASLRDDN